MAGIPGWRFITVNIHMIEPKMDTAHYADI